jgi:uncharacterized protein (DUF952 family)
MDRIYHIVSGPEWQAACEVGRYAPASLAAEGFVHFSFEHQVAPTANRLYRDRADLIVIEVDPILLGEPVVVEDLYGLGEEFPHVYAAIPTSAAVQQWRLRRDGTGDWAFG